MVIKGKHMLLRQCPFW